MVKNLQTFAQKVYTAISVRYTAKNLLPSVNMGLINFSKKLLKIMLNKNTSNTPTQPEPAPHPCANWSTIDCHMLARGYNEPFWTDPYKNDVDNNDTMPCSTDDCNNAGLDSTSLSPGYYVIIGLGGLLAVAAMVILYRKIGGSIQNHYVLLRGDTENPLTAAQLKKHDQESQYLNDENHRAYESSHDTGERPGHLDTSPDFSAVRVSPSTESTSSRDDKYETLDTNPNFANMYYSSDDESRSEDGKSSNYTASTNSPDRFEPYLG